MTPILIDINVAGEWGEFFVAERSPRYRQRDGVGYWTYAATFCCYSSFGTYGHHWSHMGEPFHEFVQHLDEDYLLSKIAHKENSPEKLVRNVRDRIKMARHDRGLSKEDARAAWDAVYEIESEYGGEAIGVMLYENHDIHKAGIEWCDIGGQEWPIEASQFVRKLWPLFAAEYKKLKERGNVTE